MARMKFALALHGGAGAIPKDSPAEQVQRYEQSLRKAVELGRGMLDSGAAALDTVEAVVRALEDDELFNAGRGAVFTRAGTNELDASIMDGSTRRCGAVAGVQRVKNPVTLARRVMEKTEHVLLMGDGAEAFAKDMGVELADPIYFYTERRYQQLLKARSTNRMQKDHDVRVEEKENKKGTVGCVALDSAGRLAAATSTGGLTNKMAGRIGDTPVIGAGTYADDLVAVSCTGIGEQFIRNAVAFHISALMRYAGRSVDEAAGHVVSHVLKPDDGGLIAVDGAGRIVMPFNTPGMYRACADASGRVDVRIW